MASSTTPQLDPVPLLHANAPLTTGSTFPVYSPHSSSSSSPLWHASSATPAEARLLADAAQSAFPAWSATTAAERRDLLLRATTQLEADAPEISAAMMAETGATAAWCAFNVATAAAFMRDVAGRISSAVEGRVVECAEKRGNGGEVVGEGARMCMVWKEPYGVVLGIAPWNAPLILGIRAIVYPLAAGNTVLFKASEHCPKTHYLLSRIFAKSAFPPSVVSTLFHSRSTAAAVTAALIAHPAVQKINFTGSTAVGRKLAAVAGEHLKPLVLELGGKAPFVVLEDADLKAAAQAAAFGAFHHAGQICMSTEKILIVGGDEKEGGEAGRTVDGSAVGVVNGNGRESREEVFLRELRAAVGEVYGDSQVMALREGREKLIGLIKSAQEDGAKVLSPTSPTSSTPSPNAHPNLILTSLPPSSSLYHTESFGPCVSILSVPTEAAAIAHANNTEYGLSSAVWTRDLARGLRVARQLQCGAVHVNGATVHDEPNLPHGGRKASGFGRFGGLRGVEEFLVEKTVSFRV